MTFWRGTLYIRGTSKYAHDPGLEISSSPMPTDYQLFPGATKIHEMVAHADYQSWDMKFRTWCAM